MSSERIRVLQVVPKLRTGGGEKVAMDLAEYLDSSQFDVEIVSLMSFSNEPFEKHCHEAGIKVNYLRKHLGIDLRVFFDVYKIVREFRPHVIHNHLHGLYTILPSALINRIPIRIHTIHSLADKEADGIHRIIQKYAFRYLQVVPVSISRNIAESVRKLYGNIYSPIIYNGIDTQKYSLSPDQRIATRKSLGIPESAFVFVNIASLRRVKNHHLLVITFDQVLKLHSETYLLLVGDGPLRNDISHLINQLGISENVILTGNRADIPNILSASDCFVLSSDWEGFPISVLEAIAAGLPVVATNVGGIAEVVMDSVNGLLVQKGDCEQLAHAMLTILRNPINAKNMGISGKELVKKNYDVSKMAFEYGELYKKTLHHKFP